MRKNLPYLGKRSLIAPDSYGSSSWQLADENSATPFLPPLPPLPSPAQRASSSSPSCGALEMPDSLLFLVHLTIRTTKWKHKAPISLAARERKKGSRLHQGKAWSGLSDRKELKSTQGNLEIYIQSPPLWKTKLHSWHPIFLPDTPCKIDQYKLVTPSRQERRDGTTGNSTHNNQRTHERVIVY